MSAALDSALQHPGIWRGGQLARAEADALPTGFAELDALLRPTTESRYFYRAGQEDAARG